MIERQMAAALFVDTVVDGITRVGKVAVRHGNQAGAEHPDAVPPVVGPGGQRPQDRAGDGSGNIGGRSGGKNNVEALRA
jgi:hypothetical protein